MNKNQVTQRQHEILLGTILGDAHLELAPNKLSARLRLAQTRNHKFYIEHLSEVFSNWDQGRIRDVTKQPSITGKRLVEKTELDINYSPVLLEYHKRFYVFDPNENRYRKIIPRTLDNDFTARSFAYLFMDDGSIKSSDSN